MPIWSERSANMAHKSLGAARMRNMIITFEAIYEYNVIMRTCRPWMRRRMALGRFLTISNFDSVLVVCLKTEK